MLVYCDRKYGKVSKVLIGTNANVRDQILKPGSKKESKGIISLNDDFFSLPDGLIFM